MAPIGAYAIFAEAIDDKAAEFYAAFGFAALVKWSRARPRVYPRGAKDIA